MKFVDILNDGSLSVSCNDTYDCGNDNKLFLFYGMTKTDYARLISDVRVFGYSEIQSSEIDKFSSVTLSDNSNNIIITYDHSSGEIRVVDDCYSAPLNTNYSKAGKCPVRMWQFEVDHTLIDCGMCYIIQCTDYSFVIIDSAHAYSLNDDVRLYEFLRRETPKDLPVVISAWYLSHGHADHICKCLDFILYNKNAIVKGLFYNFVPNDHFSAENWLIADIQHTDLFNREIAKKTEITKYKLHSGQYFYIDCLRFDVLCSHEDVYPLSLEDYNDSSVMVMVSIDGDKISFPGDASSKAGAIAENRFPEFLKCDIVQVSHHGHFGTSVGFYEKSQAKVALFPVTQIKFDEEYPRIEANRVACEIAEHTYIASNGTVMFTFPLKNSEILIYPDETNESFDGIFNLWTYDYSEEFKKNHIEKFHANNEFKEEKF